MRTLGDAGLYKYKWCNNLREVEQVNIFFLKDIADTIRYFVGNNIGLLYHNESKLFVCVPNSSAANVQHAVSQLFNSNIIVEYQDSSNLIDVLSVELGTLLGEENFALTIDNDTQTLHMAFTAAVWDTKMNEVESLLKRVLPMNLDVKYEPFPLDFTELEYLEDSGTQYISIPERFWFAAKSEDSSGFAAKVYELPGNYYFNVIWGISALADGWFNNTNINLLLGRPATLSTKLAYYGKSDVGSFPNNCEYPVTAYFNWLNDGKRLMEGNGLSFSSVVMFNTHWKSNLVTPVEHQFLFAQTDAINNRAIFYAHTKRIYWAKFSQGSEVTRDLIPVLDASGTPCMYDKISRQCFYNVGSGTFGYKIKTPESEASTFSLRDPYYTAPSGVWAKLIAENELDIIADTDMEDGEKQGYMWFANTSEAYEHFGIKEEPLNNI